MHCWIMHIQLELMKLLWQFIIRFSVLNAALPFSLSGPRPCLREQNISATLQESQVVKYFWERSTFPVQFALEPKVLWANSTHSNLEENKKRQAAGFPSIPFLKWEWQESNSGATLQTFTKRNAILGTQEARKSQQLPAILNVLNYLYLFVYWNIY